MENLTTFSKSPVGKIFPLEGNGISLVDIGSCLYLFHQEIPEDILSKQADLISRLSFFCEHMNGNSILTQTLTIGNHTFVNRLPYETHRIEKLSKQGWIDLFEERLEQYNEKI